MLGGESDTVLTKVSGKKDTTGGSYDSTKIQVLQTDSHLGRVCPTIKTSGYLMKKKQASMLFSSCQSVIVDQKHKVRKGAQKGGN